MSLYKGNNLISGHQVLYSTTGNNTDGAMTQKAGTELVKFANVQLQGSALVLSNFVVSGFSQAAYVKLPQAFSPTSTWLMHFKFTYIANSSDNQVIIDANDRFKAVRPITIYISASTSKVAYGLSSDATNWNIGGLSAGSTVLVSGTTYYLKAEFTGSAYNFYLSTDDETWTLDYTVSSSTYILNGYALIMGLYLPNCTAPFVSSFDLKECYIDVNNERWWNGVEVAENGDTLRVGNVNAGTLSPQEICSLSINSASYEDITKPASGGSFVAPYDGTVAFQHRIATSGQYIAIANVTRGYATRNHSTANNMLLNAWVPCRKNDTIYVEYTGSSTTTTSNFLRCFKALGGR